MQHAREVAILHLRSEHAAGRVHLEGGSVEVLVPGYVHDGDFELCSRATEADALFDVVVQWQGIEDPSAQPDLVHVRLRGDMVLIGENGLVGELLQQHRPTQPFTRLIDLE